MKRLVLIDGNSLIHRAYHALPPLNAPNGEQVNAVYGFTAMLLRVLQELKPEYIAMTFDLPAPTFRHLQYVGYKANRPAADSELVPQFAKVRDVVRAFNIPIFEVAGYEADDLVGTLAAQAEELKDPVETIIVSGDMDTLQLVDESTKVFAPRKGISDTVLYDIKGVEEKCGFGPEHVIDFKGLKGDTSDNIPGVPGIGDKTAQTLIQTYGTLEDVYEHLDDLKGKIKENLIEFAEQAKMSKTLATIDRKAPIKLKLEETKTHDFDRDTILKMFQQFGFRSLVSRLAEVFPPESLTEIVADNELAIEEALEEQGQIPDQVRDDTSKMDVRYKLIDNGRDLKDLIKNLQKAGEFAFDTETNDWRPTLAKMVGCSFSYKAGEAFYVPFDEEFLALLKPILEDPKIKKIGHNIKFDALVLENHGVYVRGISFDTMVAAWLVSPGTYSLGLKNLAYQELGITMQEITELIGKGKSQLTMDQVPVEQVVNYASADADMTFRLKSIFEKKLKAGNVLSVFEEYEMPLVPVLATMERNGVLVDTKFLNKMSGQLAKDIESCLKEIFANVGHEFNVNSPKQLAEILFEELHLPTQSRTKTGFSTDESVLSALKDSHPVIAHILQYREMTKLKSTYVDALPTMVDQSFSRLHTSFNQTGTASGRVSSNDPNLQNIPIRTELGAKIRKAFIAPEGSVILACDYSQIELRILAHLSKDPVLTEAFKKNEDVHSLTASIIYGVPQEKVTKDQRRVGKTINFALMYGMGAYSLSQSVGIPRAEAQAFIERYFLTYAQVKQFFDELLKKAAQDGFVETISGRRRYIPELKSPIQQIHRAGERMALNLPMQGTNADIIKKAMIAIQNELSSNNYKTKMILQVHDELVFEVPQTELKTVEPKIKQLMVNAFHLAVPILIESKIGPSWGELKSVD